MIIWLLNYKKEKFLSFSIYIYSYIIYNSIIWEKKARKIIKLYYSYDVVPF